MTKEERQSQPNPEARSIQMPEEEFILVRKSSKAGMIYDIIDVSEFFGESGPELKKDVYRKALEKYGQMNIRYCRVVPVKVRHDIDIG